LSKDLTIRWVKVVGVVIGYILTTFAIFKTGMFYKEIKEDVETIRTGAEFHIEYYNFMENQRKINEGVNRKLNQCLSTIHANGGSDDN
jgi:uncharacterized protein involved in cysteine biosynthesis